MLPYRQVVPWKDGTAVDPIVCEQNLAQSLNWDGKRRSLCQELYHKHDF